MLKYIFIFIFIFLSLFGFGQSQVDSILFDKINHYRDSLGIPKLIWDDNVYRMAEHHSIYIVKRCSFTPEELIPSNIETPSPKLFFVAHDEDIDVADFDEINLMEDRFKKYVGNPKKSNIISENVFDGYIKKNNPEYIANEIFSGWLHSKSHKENMLNPKLVHAACCTVIKEDTMILYRKNVKHNFVKCKFKIFILGSTINFYR